MSPICEQCNKESIRFEFYGNWLCPRCLKKAAQALVKYAEGYMEIFNNSEKVDKHCNQPKTT